MKHLALTNTEVEHLTTRLVDKLQHAEPTSTRLSTYTTAGYKHVPPRVYVHGDAHFMVRAILDELGVAIVTDEAPASEAIIHAKWPLFTVITATAFLLGILAWNLAT